MLITKSNNTELGTRKRTLFRSLSFGPTSVKLAGVILLALIALFYLAQQTQSATRNYAIQSLESQKKEIEAAKADKQVEALRLKSLQEVQNKAKELGLGPE